jgi:hypothetical protein
MIGINGVLLNIKLIFCHFYMTINLQLNFGHLSANMAIFSNDEKLQ